MQPLIHIILLLAAWVVCQALPRHHAVHVLTAAGFAAIYIFAPVSALFILFCVAEATLMVLVFARIDRQSAWRKYGPYLLLPNLLFVELHGLILSMPLAVLGISFSVIRIYMTVKQILSSRKAIPASDTYWLLPAGFFLPAVVIGPIFSGADLRDQSRKADWAVPDLQTYRLILQGLILVVLVSPATSDLIRGLDFIRLDYKVLTAPILFVQLFAAFWGQSLIAEHSARVFGYRLPVNFDAPWKAATFKDFWARWHRSMANFVLQYIFLPLNLNGVPPKVATVMAFVFMGMWHNLSPGYLVWGFAHGLLLAYSKAPPEAPAARWRGRIVVFTVVIALSWFANYGPYS